MAVAHAIGTGKGPKEIYEQIKKWAAEMKIETLLMKAIVDAATGPPADYLHQQGWVLIAFQNVLWHGVDAIPALCRDKLLNCRLEAGRPHVQHPRPECYWPVDALAVAECLVTGGKV